MFLFTFSLAMFVAAFFLAYLEINIEGRFGWAWLLPTWYRDNRLFRLIMKKPLTGYHLSLGVFLIFFFHLPVITLWLTGGDWSIGKELFWLAIYFVWVPVWDFLWFVLNPWYGVKNFKKDNVPWHANDYWLMERVPVGIYLMPLFIAFGLSLLAEAVFRLDAATQNIFWFAMIQLVLTVIVAIFIAPPFKRGHAKMLDGDDARNIWQYFPKVDKKEQ